MKLSEYEEQIIYERFGIPKVGEGLLEVLFNAGELSLLLHGNDEFAAEAYPKEFVANAYHRGVISKCDESGRRYRISDFYSMLDVFAVSRKDEYDALPKEKRKALDDWYFDAYYDRLEPAEEATKDVVLTLDETLEFIEGQERQAYLNFCDCRMLKGDCGLPTDTCVTYKDGINSFVDRGLSKKISKEEAKEVIRRADAAGLMHTAGMGGICNCCGDCCYLFRAQKRRESVGVWPAAKHIVSLDQAKCIGCGKCTRRCHFGVFSMEGAASGSAGENGISGPGLPSSPYYELGKKYFPKGPGAILGVRIKGGLEAALAVLEKVQIFDYMVNVGDAKSLIVHPASSTHYGHPADEQEAAGVYPDTLRLSVGIEDAEDLIADLTQALK